MSRPTGCSSRGSRGSKPAHQVLNNREVVIGLCSNSQRATCVGQRRRRFTVGPPPALPTETPRAPHIHRRANTALARLWTPFRSRDETAAHGQTMSRNSAVGWPFGVRDRSCGSCRGTPPSRSGLPCTSAAPGHEPAQSRNANSPALLCYQHLDVRIQRQAPARSGFKMDGVILTSDVGTGCRRESQFSDRPRRSGDHED